MKDLYKRVVEDPAIKELILKAQGFTNPPLVRPVVVMECRSSKFGTAYHPRMIYSNREEYEAMFTEEVRAGFNGRTVIHEVNSRRFDCITDIVDGADENKKGHWVVIERISDNDFVAKEFEKKEELDKQLLSTLNKSEGYTLVHQYGTKDYLLIEETATVRMEKSTENAKEFSATIAQSEPLTPHEPHIEFTEPPELDLREEELKQLNEKKE